MLEALEQWSYTRLGQWHYVLGYLIVLLSHNWPLLLGGGAGIWSAARAIRQPSRPNLCWLYASLSLVAAYEYHKHIAGELHEAVDFLLLGDLAILNGAGHALVGPGITMLMFASCPLFILYGIWLSSRRHDYVREAGLYRRPPNL